MLVLDDVHAHYGKSHVLHGVSLRIERGEVVGLLGRNGVGKSTTLKAVMGLVRPTGGHVTLEGGDITGLPPHRLARMGIAWVPEDRRIFRLLTVFENLRTGLDRSGVSEARRAELLEKVYQSFPVLAERRRQAGGHAVGRRAADAGHRPGHDARAQDHPARRADRGAHAAHGRPDPGDHPRCSTGTASPSCSWSRTCR